VASTSFIAKLDDDERAHVLRKVRALAAGGFVELAYDCTVHLYRRT
jgi:hypothetical protein